MNQRRYSYSAYDRAGVLKRGTLEAPSSDEARDAIARQGLFVQSLHDGTETRTPAAGARGGGSRSRRLRDLSGFCRQLSVLVRTGTPLVDAVSVLERQLPAGAWRTVVTDIRTRVEEGMPLAAAMEHHPRYFDPVARSLVAAGESRGSLGEMLENLSQLIRQQMKIRSAVLGAMVYPTLLICVALGVVNVMMFFVLPRFEGLFKNLGAPLPPSTQVLMGISLLVRERWYAVLGAAAGLIVAGRVYLASGPGRRMIDTLAVRAPVMGPMVRSFATARMARLLGTLLEGKVGMLDALRLARQAATNQHYAELLEHAEGAVSRGESIAGALDGRGLVSASVVEAVRSGERTGQIGPVLTTIAGFLDEDNEVVVKGLSSIIEPLILLVLGAVVGFVAISMFLPLFDLTAAGGAMGPGGGGTP